MEQQAPTPEQLVQARRQGRITTTDFALSLGIDRTTLWKRENYPQTAPAGWWDLYAATLRDKLTERHERALAAVGQGA